MLEYEKDMLKSISAESSLVISAGGLNVLNTVQKLASLYANPHSFLILLNLSASDLACLCVLDAENFTDISKLTIAQRRSAYKRGGIFHGASRAFITDFVNKNIDVGRISSILVLNTECIREDGTEAFILHIFKEHNELGLVRAFTNDPLQLSHQSLFSISKFLNIQKIVLYPRFHKKVAASFPPLEATQVFTRQSAFVEEIALLIIELVKNIYSAKFPRAGGIGYEKILLYRYKDRDVQMFQRLTRILFACDSLSFYMVYKSLFDEQKALGADGTWIYTGTCHLLLEKARVYLESDIARSSRPANRGRDSPESANRGGACGPEDGDCLSATENGKYSLNLFTSQFLVQEFMEEMEPSAEESELDVDSDAEEGGTAKRTKTSECVETDTSNGEHEAISAERLRNFYLANPKIRKLYQIVGSSKKDLAVVLVQDRVVKNTIANLLKCLIKDREIKVCVLSDFERDQARYDLIILISPDLKAIRSVEYYGAAHPGCEIFILVFKNSLEEQLYLTEVREEKMLFNRFIEEKVSMPMAGELDVLDIGEDGGLEHEIIVDSREMNARLPYYLYKAGNKIDIRVLKVGDYVFGSKCIERKSIEDFRSSLNTGRLYNQAVRMVFNHDNPILLLEFDNCMPTLFLFETTENFNNSLIARFCLFLVNFSQFRVLWTDNPVFSVKIIRDIQRRDAEDSHGCDGLGLHGSSHHDPILHDILLGIPGINSFNLYKVLNAFTDLHDLAFASFERLEASVGKERAGDVYRFFREMM